MDRLDDFLMTRPATAARPLLGMTVLVVDDSRYASEALRLLCLRSGARIRRADSLYHARRHLRVYRPTAVIVDLGLPDGSGADLISELARAQPRVEILLGTSGDPGAEAVARAAGADGFLEKPIASLARFQTALLAHVPRDQRPGGLRALADETVAPDRIAFRDDLALAADILSGEDGGNTLDYVTQFLGGVSRSAGDTVLTEATTALLRSHKAGHAVRSDIARLAALVQDRLVASGPL
ncbi:MAG: response regulator [Rhodobacterales bacterium]|nr:response regulator [Rhodobacterales bacterium]NCT13629.1 response regulator [Rhodobacterales bacterium]